MGVGITFHWIQVSNYVGGLRRGNQVTVSCNCASNGVDGTEGKLETEKNGFGNKAQVFHRLFETHQ